MKRLLILLVMLPLAAAAQFGRPTQAQREANQQLSKFIQFYQYLNGSYIDPVDNGKLVEKAIVDILAELDPHSYYNSAEEMVEIMESYSGSFAGIGVSISAYQDSTVVMTVISGGPSEKVGIIPNDRIVTVDGGSVVGMTQTDVVSRLRGEKGTNVTVGIVRHGTSDLLTFNIVRDDIALETVDAAYMITPTTGYIRVNRFAQTTMTEFAQAFAKFNSPQSLILDLRSNGGGLLDQSIRMANFFFPRGTLVVSTEGRMVPSEEYKTTSDGAFQQGKVIVLIDDFSASASEIVAGALQDWDRAVIVGRRSFGKGLVQRQFPLEDGSAVSITVSRYLTPTGRAIQRPFEKGNSTGYYEDLAGRFESGYIDTLANDESQRYTTLKLGKTVYGGDGIYPDYYVESDTSGYSEWLSEVIRQGVIHEFNMDFLDANRSRLQQEYPSFASFRDNYRTSDQTVTQLADFAAAKGIARNERGIAQSRETIDLRLKFLLAQNLWGLSEAYEIYNTTDPVVIKALEVLSHWGIMADGYATDRF